MDIKKAFNELSVLFPILTLYTLVYLGLMIYDFVAKGSFELPSGMMIVYVALTGAYAADKEIRRWTGKETPPRKGTLFVYLWMVFYLVVFIIHCLKPDYALPNDLTSVTLQVLGIFFGSKISKQIFQSRAQKLVKAVLEKVAPSSGTPVTEPAPPQNNVPAPAKIEIPRTDSSLTPTLSPEGRGSKEEETILDVIRQKGQAKREDFLAATGMSKSSLGRLLDKMETDGKIMQVGERKASYYKLADKK